MLKIWPNCKDINKTLVKIIDNIKILNVFFFE